MKEQARLMSEVSSLEVAFRLHYDSILRLAVFLTGSRDRGEDLAQEAFVRAGPKLGNLHVSQVRPYLVRTAVNIWKNDLRRLRLERRHAVRVSVDPMETDLGEAILNRSLLWPHVCALPPRQRACLILRFYEDLRERDVAELLGCSVGTVKKQTARALSRLREAVGDEH